MLRLPICTLFPYTTLFRSEEIALSDRLAHLLEEWKYRDPVLNDFGHHMELFPPASYLYILLGLVPNYQHNTVEKRSDGRESLLAEVAAIEQKLTRKIGRAWGRERGKD